jgi:hypothetical protein
MTEELKKNQLSMCSFLIAEKRMETTMLMIVRNVNVTALLYRSFIENTLLIMLME